MKQNLQPPATPLEMLSLFFPAGLLDYFDLVNHVSQAKSIPEALTAFQSIRP